MRSRTLLAVLVTSAGLMALAACSGGESAGGSSTTSKAAASTTTADSTTSTAKGGATGAGTTPPGDPKPSPGCSATTATPAVDRQRRTMDVAGTERWYLITTPEDPAGQPLPLVVDIHGLAEGAELHANSSGMEELAAKDGFVAVWPQGSGERMPAWDIRADSPDMAYIDALVQQVGAQQCIDMSRVYATGMSNGAIMSSALACYRSGTFAAVAPVAGVTFFDGCHPDHKIPVVAFHGTADPILRFNGGVGGDVLTAALSGQSVSTTAPPPTELDGPGYPASAASFAQANGCTSRKDTEVTAEVIHRVWTCPKGGETEFWIIKGGGHTIPGSQGLASVGIAKIIGPTNMDISSAQQSWDFLSRQRRT